MTTKGLYIEKYSPAAHEEWNKTARRMRQSSFLMERDFMDYHADRYEDASLMVRQTDGRTVALLPACRSRSERHCIESHGGLTYGGLLLGTEVTAAAFLHSIPVMAPQPDPTSKIRQPFLKGYQFNMFSLINDKWYKNT